MSEPITRPDEIAEIASDDTKFKYYMVRQTAEMSQWRKDHEEKDNKRFEDLTKQLAPVTLFITETEGVKNQFVGAKKLAVIIGSVLTGIPALIGGAIWLVNHIQIK